MPTVLVVGSGIAGLTAALGLSATHAVTLVTKAESTECNTLYAQGGIAAAVSADDSVESHMLDTLRAGAGLNTYEAVEALCCEGTERVRDLIRHGVRFDRDGQDHARGLEAAHSHARVLHAGGDATGAAIENALIAAARASSVRILENTYLADLIVDDGRVVGAQLLQPGAVPVSLFADTVVLATGGAGQLYRHTTNPTVTTGDGVAAARRAGAELAHVEFYQFHPTALAVPGSFLVSEAVRGEGAVLVNAAGERFMARVHPDAELAPRDVVARAIALEMAAQGGTPVQLDATALGRAFLSERFPTIDASTRAAGFDWGREAIPVTPAAHYWMGGVATDADGHTSLPGLYAVGEVACTGAHGANRLASNSLLEGLVFANRAARAVASDDRKSSEGPAGVSRPVHEAAGSRHVVDRTTLQQLMWDCAGVLRSGESLKRASDTLTTWTGADRASATIAQREDANLLELAREIVRAAHARRESRGAHFRSDFPSTSQSTSPNTSPNASLIRERVHAC